MNIVFWMIIMLFIFLLWLFLSMYFKAVGWFFGGLWEDAMDEMNIDNKKEEKEDDENE